MHVGQTNSIKVCSLSSNTMVQFYGCDTRGEFGRLPRTLSQSEERDQHCNVGFEPTEYSSILSQPAELKFHHGSQTSFGHPTRLGGGWAVTVIQPGPQRSMYAHAYIRRHARSIASTPAQRHHSYSGHVPHTVNAKTQNVTALQK